MGNFAALLHNENIKIYSRVRTWVMLGILALLAAGFPLLIYSTSNPANQPSHWDSFQMTISILFFLTTIFTIVIAADSVAGEFSWGTVKLLLIRPWNRSSILFSKYLAMVLFSLLATVVLTGFAYAASWILFDPGEFTVWAMFKEGGGRALDQSAWTPVNFLLADIGCRYLQLFMTAGLAFMISSVFRASGLAIGLSMFLIFANSIIANIFSPESYAWAKYLLFSHMDLHVYLSAETGPGGVTLGMALAVLAAYYAAFMLVSWTVFSRRDVAA